MREQYYRGGGWFIHSSTGVQARQTSTWGGGQVGNAITLALITQVNFYLLGLSLCNDRVCLFYYPWVEILKNFNIGLYSANIDD